MSNPRPLTNAPITEALLDVRVQLAEGFSARVLEEATTHLTKEFPNRQEQFVISGGFEAKAGDVSQTEFKSALRGFLFRDAEESRVVQFRIDGFTFSHLRPYDSWDKLLAETRRAWELYVRIAEPVFVTRLAARYINHLTLPVPINSLHDYLVSGPALPSAVPQHVMAFLSRVTLYDEDTDLRAHVTQKLEPAEDAGSVTVLLDIDVFRSEEVRIGDPEMWEVFEGMRSLKNTIFFESLTERAIELFA